MSIRQRVPFKFADEDKEDERILDEQEQDELIQDLKEKSDAQNRQYRLLIQVVIALSGALHVVYLLSPSKEPLIAAMFPRYIPPDGFRPIYAHRLFSLLHIFIHLNLSGQILPPTHPVRQWFTRYPFTPYTLFLPLRFPILFFLSGAAPLVSLLMRNGWHDVAWWSETAALTWFVYSAHGWMRGESDSLRTLEGLRYDAKGV